MSSGSGPDLERLAGRKIYVAGHKGMVGSAIVRRLEDIGCDNLIVRDRRELDLADQAAVRGFLEAENPDHVVVAAAKVGGIHANNTYPAEFIHDNLVIETNLIGGAHAAGIGKLLFLGSSCIYPKHAPQPMAEDSLLTGTLEPTNEPYAIAKIAGIKLCESFNRQYGTDYRSLMPTNLYGPNDNFDLETSHVLPALIRKFHEAKARGDDEVEVWGTGKPRREFLFVDDLADACVFVMAMEQQRYEAAVEPMLSHLNVGTGEDIEIGDLADVVRAATGFEGGIRFNTDYPDGTPRKLMDVTRLASLGWKAKTPLRDGIKATYRWFRENVAA